MNSLDCAGFFVLGLIIGGLLIDIRYRYMAAVAGRLSEKKEKESPGRPLFSDEAREVMGVVGTVILGICVVASLIYTFSSLKDSWYRNNGYIYVSVPGTESKSYWEYRGSGPAPLKTGPAAEEK